MTKKSPLSLFAIVLVALALMMPGCASKYGQQQTKVNYYPQCYQPIKQLRDDENLVAKSTATGAVGGAVTGAIIGGLATGKASGAVAGAAAGGIAGAAGGYAYGKAQQEKRDASFLQKYASMLDEDTAGMTRVIAASKVAMQCYNKEFNQLIADYKSGKITAKELDQRYAEIRTGLQEISFILNKKYDDMSAKDAEYTKALQAGSTKDAAAKKALKQFAGKKKPFDAKYKELNTLKSEPDKLLNSMASTVGSTDTSRNNAA